MSEMVERVARAMYGELDQLGEALVKARAAIAAMREPTQRMVAAADGDGAYLDWQAMIDEALK